MISFSKSTVTVALAFWPAETDAILHASTRLSRSLHGREVSHALCFTTVAILQLRYIEIFSPFTTLFTAHLLSIFLVGWRFTILDLGWIYTDTAWEATKSDVGGRSGVAYPNPSDGVLCGSDVSLSPLPST